MPFQQFRSIRFYTFECFNDAKVTHGVFTRQGGVSPAPWAELNVGSTVGDDLTRVGENRERIFSALQRPLASMYDVWQVHGVEVITTDAPRPAQTPHQQADAILTDRPQVTLFMRFADCVPILLHDPVRHVVGLVHAGWQGTVKGTARSAIERMRAVYGSEPAEIIAAIGPSIGRHHYQVGSEVVSQVKSSFGEQASSVLETTEEGIKLDLWAANRLILEMAGVRQVEVSGICTACHTEDWFSHRGEKGRTGRFGVLISLSESR